MVNFTGVFNIVLIIVATSAQSVLKKVYMKKGGSGTFIFSAVSVMTACLFFLVQSFGEDSFSTEIIPYVLLFALGYTFATVFNFLALGVGPLSLTSLALSYSLIIPTLYGIFFDGDNVSLTMLIGLMLLAISLVLINVKKGETGITFKWIVYALLALLGNGLCSTVQAVQAQTFEGKYDGIFMTLSLTIVSAVLVVFVIVRERPQITSSLKIGALFMLVNGICNGIVNLLVMITSQMMEKSLFYPLISAGGIVLTWIISVFFYREKLTALQNAGMILGVASIVFLNV